MMQEMAGLGFTHVELSHGVRITLIPGVLKALEEGVVKVSSCHNFCPLPTGVMQAAPNLFEPSAHDKREQAQWVRHTKRSLDFAAQLGAGVLVCHLGRVTFAWFSPLRKVQKYLQQHPRASYADDPEWLRLRDRVMTRLRERRPPFWERMVANVHEVLEYAAQKGVRLGFENREKLGELPFDADFDPLFAALPAGAPVGYWHDTGHAAIKEALALIDHDQQLAHQAPRLLGCHLHDVDAALHDHLPIGTGRIDFARLRRHWRPEHRLVVELKPGTAPEAVIASRRAVEALLAS